MKMLYTEGSKGGRGSTGEFQVIAAEVITSELDLRRDELTLTEYLSRMGELYQYLNSAGESLVAASEISLGDAPAHTPFPKFESGFTPLDDVLGGCYQGILTLMGKSGHGKTSLMLAMMEALRASEVASEVWFFEAEIPQQMMLYRTEPMRHRTKFRKADTLVCGSITISDILHRVREKPDPNRVIFIDSPDVMSGGIGDGRRFALEGIYRELVTLKERSKMVVVASQSRRREGKLSLESVSEAWAKVHYSDMVVGFSKLGATEQGQSTVRMSVLKNRFGLSDRYIKMAFDYGDLTWLSTGQPTMEGSEEAFEDAEADY